MVDLHRYYAVKGKGKKKRVVKKKTAKIPATVLGSKIPEDRKEKEDTGTPQPLTEKELLELRKAIRKHPAFEFLVDDKRRREILFGDIQRVTDFDKYICEDPKPDEVELAQGAWLARETEYISGHLVRWIEEEVVGEIAEWYTRQERAFAYRIVPIEQSCKEVGRILAGRLPHLRDDWRKAYETMRQRAEECDINSVSYGRALPVNPINAFKEYSRQFTETVLLVYTEARIYLDKLEKAGGKAGDKEEAYISATQAIQLSNRVLDRKKLDKAIAAGRVRWKKPSKKRKNVHIQDVIAEISRCEGSKEAKEEAARMFGEYKEIHAKKASGRVQAD